MECYIEYNLHAYDVAAGILIVREANGKVTNFKNETSDCEEGVEICASNTNIHEACITLIKTYM
jgi:myo-inositol-1(or 4)-monophosphatase